MNMRLLLPALALAAVFVAGCGKPADPASSGAGGDAPAKLSESKELEVAVFKGGFGSDFYEQCAKEYAEKNGITATVTGDPRIWEQIRPRFVQGSPPDLTFPGWGLDHWALVTEDQVMPLDAVLAEAPHEGSGTWRDTFEPGLLKLGQMDGKQYVMPYFVSVLGWWYKPDLFAANGWTAPKTWDEMLALCEKIKAKGIAPITYQGQYPDYMIAGMLLPWVISDAGVSQFNAMQNLEPGAWKHASVAKAASMILELKTKGYLQDGATAMSHTEAQTQFVTGKAAMVPCGTWLYSEMEKSMPAGTQMEFFLPPVIASGKGDASAMMVKIEPWLIPSKAKNQKHAVGLFKYMTSLEKAKAFVQQKGTLMAVKGSDEVDLPAQLKTPAAALKASKAVWSSQWKEWYPSFYKAVEGLITTLLNGEITAEQFAERCEAEAEKVRNDPDILKHKVSA